MNNRDTEISFGIGLLVLGLLGLLLPLSPAVQMIPPFTDPNSEYVQGIQGASAISIVASVILFYLAYKNRVL